MKKYHQISVIFAMVIMSSACASAVGRHQQAEQHLLLANDCSNAHDHIQMLKDERASTAEKFANGVASILPTAAIVSLFSGEFSSRVAIASGQFDQMLYMKIDSITKECMLAPDPERQSAR